MFIDKPTKHLITEALQSDKKENLNRAPCNRNTNHLDRIVHAICSSGISFGVWKKQNANGKASGMYDFTSLMRSDKKILLEKLPSKLEGIITPEASSTVIKIWKVPYHLQMKHYNFSPI